VYIADTQNNRIRVVNTTSGIIKTIAGNGTAIFFGDGGLASKACLSYPQNLVIDTSRQLLYFNDGICRVRAVNLTSNIIYTVAGNGNRGYTGDGGIATNATFDFIYGMGLDPVNQLLYVSDMTSSVVSLTVISYKYRLEL
jgi:hypothetical protein